MTTYAVGDSLEEAGTFRISDATVVPRRIAMSNDGTRLLWAGEGGSTLERRTLRGELISRVPTEYIAQHVRDVGDQATWVGGFCSGRYCVYRVEPDGVHREVTVLPGWAVTAPIECPDATGPQLCFSMQEHPTNVHRVAIAPRR